MFRQLLLAAFLGVAACAPEVGYGVHGAVHGGHGGLANTIHPHKPPKYSFGYGVQDPHYGANFGHQESRDGYLTKGEYHVQLPDGRLQKVSYHVDEWGYHPVVTYVGKAHFPTVVKGGGYH